MQVLLGHSKLETAKRYAHVSTGVIAGTASPLDKLSIRANAGHLGRVERAPRTLRNLAPTGLQTGVDAFGHGAEIVDQGRRSRACG
ncbi:MAG: hypothetical protein WB715_09515 [Roseiarcus sp.]|uniref:hypothetical protein n=1 Tax=Roseiarcus sp. TaxID=1969460 RepID=UPI003C4DA13C